MKKSMSGTDRIILVLGGARSGKSRYAEGLAEMAAGQRTYIATAELGDTEMASRIAAHRMRRGAHWITIEEPLDLTGAIRKASVADGFILVDCLTLWLSNLMLAERDCEDAVSGLINVLSSASGAIVLVSNEVGSGIVPDNALARRFRDIAGETNQRIAKTADEVVLVTVGLPMVLKPPRT